MSGKVVAVIEIRRDITGRKLIEAEMDKRNRETRALADIAMALNHPAGLQETLSVFLYRSIDITGADVGTIRILDEDTRELVLWDKFSIRKLGVHAGDAQTAEARRENHWADRGRRRYRVLR